MPNPPLFSRDLSWLSFNERLLMEAEDERVPLLERLKFLAIYSSNLNEFYRVRVATIRRLQEVQDQKAYEKLSAYPAEVLKAIEQTVPQHLHRYGRVLREQLIPALARHGIIIYYNQPVPKQHHEALTHYFRSRVLAHLRPGYLDDETTIFLENNQPYLLSQCADGTTYTCINVPTHALPRFYEIPDTGAARHIVFLDDIVRLNQEDLFSDVGAESYSVMLSRDAELFLEDEYEGNLVEKVKRQLGQREVGSGVRLLCDSSMPLDLRQVIVSRFGLSEQDVVVGGHYHNLDDLMALTELDSELMYPVRPPIVRRELRQARSLIDAVAQKDQLLFFPYHAYDDILRFFGEAAVRPDVTEICVSLYRVAHGSQIVQSLITAARNGKKVSVFVEVKARFDEENNLQWAEHMEAAGVHVVYSIPDLKVHSKLALVTRRLGDTTERTAYVGTGNFNEKTARLYTDCGLLTAHADVTEEVSKVFDFLCEQQPITTFRHLLVSPFNLKVRCSHLIDQEMAAARAQQPARIILKMNNLEDPDMIERLYAASQAGVDITLLVRGICCLRPQMAGVSERIRVIRLVGQWLEHTRVYWFYHGGDEQYFLSSADWMRRNLYRRIEVGVPVYDTRLQAQLKEMLTHQIEERTRAVTLDEDLRNVRYPHGSSTAHDAQETTYRWLADREA